MQGSRSLPQKAFQTVCRWEKSSYRWKRRLLGTIIMCFGSQLYVVSFFAFRRIYVPLVLMSPGIFNTTVLLPYRQGFSMVWKR